MPKPINPNAIRRVLLIRTDRMGDVVVTTPTFSAIKKSRPNLYVALMVSEENRHLVEGNPFLDEIFFSVGKKKGRCHK